MTTVEEYNEIAEGYLPRHLGIKYTRFEGKSLTGTMEVKKFLMAPNGFLHGGSVVAFADSLAGVACLASLSEEATGFTTIELKSNFLGTAVEGTVAGRADPVHLGKTTQVWDVEVWRESDDKVIARFRCTQLILTKQ